jgi:plasmid stabilization system protein ParE
MGFKIIFSPQSLERLGEIVRYIAQDNPAAALRFGMKMLDHAQLLSDFPELGRRLLVKPYFIYYRVQQEAHTVKVLDFWHGARQEPTLF